MRSNLDHLTDTIVQRAGVSPSQARITIMTILQYLTARLPSPIVGQLKILLDNDKIYCEGDR